MSDQIASKAPAERQDALEHSFTSTLETITDLPSDEVEKLATELAETTIKREKRIKRTEPDITFVPKNPSRILLRIQLKNTTRSPQQILEDYLEERDKDTEGWRIKQGEERGSLQTFVATRGHKKSSGSSSSGSKDDVEELKDQLSDLDESSKRAIAEVLG